MVGKEMAGNKRFYDFVDASDGRLTVHSSGQEYRLREAILMSKQLGRPLTENEMKKFEIK